MTHLARVERRDLCTTLLRVGPDAPTLCTGWTTRDLAAHLVVRERRPDAVLGLVLPALAGRTERLQADQARTEWAELVALLRSGPPTWSPSRLPPLDDAANTAELFVHHEDVLRAQPGWRPRLVEPRLQHALWGACGVVGRLALRGAPVGVELVAPGHGRVTARRADPGVRVEGPPAELLLFAFGRRSVAQVQLDGSPDAVRQLTG